MSFRIDVNSPGQLGAGLAGGGQANSSASGRLNGVPVQVHDADSILTDAAEELSLYQSEKVESKSHSQRNVRASDRPRTMTIARINEYLNKAKSGSDPAELVMLARRMLQAGQNPGQLARNTQGFNSPTEQYLVLQYARELGTADGASPAALERIEDALGDLEAWFGKVIETNLATIEQAGQYGSTATEVRDFQNAVHLVLGKPTLAQALQEVLQLAGQAGNKLESALSNLMGALGACLAATGSAAEKALLEALVTDLYHLKAIKTLLEDCKALVRNMKKKAQAAGSPNETAPARRKSRSGDGEDDAER